MIDIVNITITGGSALTIFGFILWLLEHPETYDRFKAWIIKPFIKGHKRLQQHFLASNIQSKLNDFSHHIMREMDEDERYKVNIRWVNQTNASSFFEQNSLVIRMDCTENANRNLSLATLVYVSQVLASQSKPFADTLLRRTIDLIATKKILDTHGSEYERKFFNNSFLFPTLEADAELKHDCEGMSLLEQKGYFTSLFLRELRHLGNQLHGTIPTDEVRREIRIFLNSFRPSQTLHLYRRGVHVSSRGSLR